ncbi:MAG: RagB/SusD family nutrient uptake outer membrane protein [Hymenobacter sp.]
MKGDTVFATYDNKAQILKYYVPGKPIAPNNPDGNFAATNYPLLRYADVLLLAAEAENELNGNSAEAQKYYLQVRRRSNQNVTAAQDPLLAPGKLNQLQMRSAIFAERAQELAFESNRRFDLQRWGVYLQTMNEIGLSKQNVIKNRDPRNLLVPLPVAEVLANPAVTQNPGW